jgi:hypothetical protein
VTLYTRGKKPVTAQIADDTDASYAKFKGAVKHIAGDRQDSADVVAKLKGSGFQVAGVGWGRCGGGGGRKELGADRLRGGWVSRKARIVLLERGRCCLAPCRLSSSPLPSQPTHAHKHAPSPALQVVYDINGREAVEAQPLLDALKPSLEQYIYCSSAGEKGWGWGWGLSQRPMAHAMGPNY